MGQHHSIQFTHYHDVPHSVWHTGHGALVAVGAFNGIADRWFYFHHLVCREDLSYRYFDVWEEAELERDVEVGDKEVEL